MNWGTTGILIVFGAFVLLLIFNPRISCFGKRLRSPFYPLLRKKGSKKSGPEAQDYGFRLSDEKDKKTAASTDGRKSPAKKTEDYGFRLD